ncbi:MAG: hypothetical protein ABIO38_08130 [Luteimonas sp.]
MPQDGIALGQNLPWLHARFAASRAFIVASLSGGITIRVEPSLSRAAN